MTDAPQGPSGPAATGWRARHGRDDRLRAGLAGVVVALAAVGTAAYALAPPTPPVHVVVGRPVALPVVLTPPEPADRPLAMTLTPGDGAVVGVGQAVALRLGTPVTDRAARAVLERQLVVRTVPAVLGAWHWTSPTELRYRGAGFWPAGTQVTVTAAVTHVPVAPGVWVGGRRTTSFSVGAALTSVVDVQAHTMTVSRDGTVLRVLPASTGRPGSDTRSGTFVVLEKAAALVMDSATVDLPPGTPAYRTAVEDAVRITSSGTFTHGAPWSVASQGRRNVSHGCVNLSPVDAHWFFEQVRRGDVVTVVGSPTAASPTDAGSQDWSLTFDAWVAGSALAGGSGPGAPAGSW